MGLIGGKRKVNKGLKDWVTFVKKVQKEENISYPDAIHRAKERKDKGEKWMTGGNSPPSPVLILDTETSSNNTSSPVTSSSVNSPLMGGKKRRTMRKSKCTKRKTARKSGSRKTRRH
jgi:hypothetical protein